VNDSIKGKKLFAMKNYLLLILSVSTSFAFAQSPVFTPEEEEDIYNYFLEESPYALLPLETFVTKNYLQLVGEETIDLISDHRRSDRKVKIIHTDSGYVFCNISGNNSASYGLMKNVAIDFNYVHNSEDLEQSISFNWHFYNTYNEISGIAPVKIRRQFNPEGEEVSIDVWIEVPEDQRRKNETAKKGYTLFLHGEIMLDEDQNNQTLFRL
jgi:hypothetical protein